MYQGKLVQVKGKQMHIRQMGSGKTSIVLLPGLCMPLPSVEFAPLMRDLSQKYTVCVVEIFGYGYSDGTNSPRTNENHVEEIREGLKQAGLQPPYVLMPFSCTGIYSEYYAAKYPQEVAGLILLDTSATVAGYAEMFASEEFYEEFFPSIASIASIDGKDVEDSAEEPAQSLDMDETIAEYVQHGYTAEEVDEIIKTMDTLMHVNTQSAQTKALSANVFEVLSMPIPKEIPILMFYSDERYDGLEEEDLHFYKKCYSDHMCRLGEHAKLVVVEGSTHDDIYYHSDARKVICSAIDAFLAYRN